MAELSVVQPEDAPSYLVRITGISTKTTEDALQNFFENTRRSGGGEIKDIQLNLEEGTADITFASTEGKLVDRGIVICIFAAFGINLNLYSGEIVELRHTGYKPTDYINWNKENVTYINY